jgi:hypothetical protein
VTTTKSFRNQKVLHLEHDTEATDATKPKDDTDIRARPRTIVKTIDLLRRKVVTGRWWNLVTSERWVEKVSQLRPLVSHAFYTRVATAWASYCAFNCDSY